MKKQSTKELKQCGSGTWNGVTKLVNRPGLNTSKGFSIYSTISFSLIDVGESYALDKFGSVVLLYASDVTTVNDPLCRAKYQDTNNFYRYQYGKNSFQCFKDQKNILVKLARIRFLNKENSYDRSLLIRCKITRIISVNIGIRSITEANNQTFFEIKPNV